MNRWLTAGLPLAILMGMALTAHALPFSYPDKEENEDKKIEKRMVIAVKADDGKVEFVGPGDITESIDVERMLGDKLPALLKFLPKDGEVKVEVRAVVVKPDGKKQTIVWEQRGEDGEDVDIRVVKGDDESASQHEGDDHDNYFWIVRAEAGGEFMIGVGCEPADEALRSHLRLGEEGLLISAVFDGTPADKAGLREYDVIVAANGEEIEELADLIAAVQEAGEKEASLALKIIRRGESEVVEVEPAKREKAEGFQKMIEERLREAQQQKKGLSNRLKSELHEKYMGQLKKLHPEISELLKKRVLLFEIDEDEHEHDGHHEHADDDEHEHDGHHEHADDDEDEHDGHHEHADNDEDEDEDVISELREQVEELQEAVEELQEALAELRDDE